jgi:RNA polymerase sigma-32 factor
MASTHHQRAFRKLQVSEAEIEQMDQRLSRQDMSLDISIGEDSENTRLDFLPALGPGIEEILGQTDSRCCWKTQDHRAQAFGQGAGHPVTNGCSPTAGDPARNRRRYGVTRERVRQIEARLLEKLKAHLQSTVKDFSPEWIKGND